MAVLLKSNAVFIHIPKTGGSWIRKVLYDNELVDCEFSHEHADLERILHLSGHYPGEFIKKSIRYRSNFEKKIQNSYKFGFVRNPVSWYVSTWRYMESVDWKNFVKEVNPSRFFLKFDRWHPFEKLYKYRSSDINVFVENILNNMPGFYTHLIYSYTGIDELDYVGRQENLKEDLLKILRHLEIDTEVLKMETKRVNQSTISSPPLHDDLVKQIMEFENAVVRKYYS